MRIECFEKIDDIHDQAYIDTVSITFADRSRSRGRASTQSGREVAWFLERGEHLHHGNVLKDPNGGLFLVKLLDTLQLCPVADSLLTSFLSSF